MTSREQFEAWFKREIIETPDFEFNTFNDDAGEYAVTEDDNIDLYLQVQAMYMAWHGKQAARRWRLSCLSYSRMTVTPSLRRSAPLASRLRGSDG
ncbi:MAG: hypothetical protein E6995_13235 [Enterobacteriaceae bacterium]|uniref:hypothetical protein n=1 Tax=Hafnia paralvei TaxID=546367 RepID=UPI000ECE023B|nr:hypothetical protein [Hafnia paralvei]MDU1193099.1 hypothetical protein [Enterobacteriaceae bacterium]MDU1245189.1 hypothetical protein [Enterobacteriaceae bacterium]HCU16518.1 hypothetical protein [Hafnia paralvei]